MPRKIYEYRFRVVLYVHDRTALKLLRTLGQLWVGGPHPVAGYGGANENDWEDRSGVIALRFWTSQRRASFLIEAQRFVPGRWTMVSTADDFPANLLEHARSDSKAIQRPMPRPA